MKGGKGSSDKPSCGTLSPSHPMPTTLAGRKNATRNPLQHNPNGLTGSCFWLLAEEGVPAEPSGLRLMQTGSPDQQAASCQHLTCREETLCPGFRCSGPHGSQMAQGEAAKGGEGRHSGWRGCGLGPGCCLFPCYFWKEGS